MWLKWLIVAASATEAAYMLIDGARALIVGDYITPSSGQYAGQLGPWARLVSGLGIEPRSSLMKWAFVGYGVAWIVILIAFAREAPWAWSAMLIAAIASLWYAMFGTAISLVVIVLLWLPAVRRLFGR